VRLGWIAILLVLAGWSYRGLVDGDRGLDLPAQQARHETRLAEAERRGDQEQALEDLVALCNLVQYTRFERNGPYCQRATTLARAQGNVEAEVVVLGAQAIFDVWIHDWDGALAKVAAGRALAGERATDPMIYLLDLATGVAQHERLEYDLALPTLERSVAAARRIGAEVPIAYSEASLARLKYALGDLRAATAHGQAALDAALGGLDGNAEWLARWVIGLVASDQGRYEAALAQWRLGLLATRRVQSVFGEATLLANVSYGLISLDRPEEALPYAARLRELLERQLIPAAWGPEIDIVDGNIAFARAAFAEAAVHFARAQASVKPRLVIRALLAQARARYRQGDLAAAKPLYEQVLVRLEQVRERSPEDQRANFLSANLAGYQELVSLLFDLEGDAGAEAAFAVAEAGRARSLLDALSAANRSAAPGPAITSAALRQHLVPGQAFIAFVSTPFRLLALVATRDALRLVALPAAGSRDQLAERVRFYRTLLMQVDDPAELAPAGRRLYDDLLAPLLPPGVTSLVVSPDGPLAYLPLDALILPDGRFLIEAVPVVQVASATLAFTAPADAVRRDRVLAVADPPAREGFPPLPFARAEAEAVLSLTAPGELLVGAAASESAVKRAPPGSIWHFATHARTDEAIPIRSALVLGGDGANDGLLTAAEIYALPAAAPIVVLSGCETGLGAWLGSEGAQSLSRAFQFAGARSVIATSWAIGDRASEPLMTAFYRRLAAGETVPVALAAAKRERIAAQAPPRVWAAFVAHGAPDAHVTPAPPRPAGPGRYVLPLALSALLALVWRLRRRK
jgi:CHAT domain-containing protein